MNREFLMLAKSRNNEHVGGWFLSEKLDGQRCLWDGGVARGVRKEDVPWANTAKDARYIEETIATGLWSRYGNVIHAPDWFLDKLPKNVMLDGELWVDYSGLQSVRRIISHRVPIDSEWAKVTFRVFDSPGASQVFSDGRINNSQFKEKQIQFDVCAPWLTELDPSSRCPELTYRTLEQHANEIVVPVPQFEVPTRDSDLFVEEKLIEVMARGGEGIMLRHPSSAWVPKRTSALLKVKKKDVDYAVVIGYTAGQGKHVGRLGALVCEYDGLVFELSGFTDQERTLIDGRWAADHPGERLAAGINWSTYFPIGLTVRFMHSGFTLDGIPREARYFR